MNRHLKKFVSFRYANSGGSGTDTTARASAAAAQTTADNALPKDGGSMAGAMTVLDAANPQEPVPLHQVQALVDAAAVPTWNITDDSAGATGLIGAATAGASVGDLARYLDGSVVPTGETRRLTALPPSVLGNWGPKSALAQPTAPTFFTTDATTAAADAAGMATKGSLFQFADKTQWRWNGTLPLDATNLVRWDNQGFTEVALTGNPLAGTSAAFTTASDVSGTTTFVKYNNAFLTAPDDYSLVGTTLTLGADQPLPGASDIVRLYSGSVATSGGGSYTLPVATATVLGGVKQGSGVTIAPDGTLSAGSMTEDPPVFVSDPSAYAVAPTTHVLLFQLSGNTGSVVLPARSGVEGGALFIAPITIPADPAWSLDISINNGARFVDPSSTTASPPGQPSTLTLSASRPSVLLKNWNAAGTWAAETNGGSGGSGVTDNLYYNAATGLLASVGSAQFGDTTQNGSVTLGGGGGVNGAPAAGSNTLGVSVGYSAGAGTPGFAAVSIGWATTAQGDGGMSLGANSSVSGIGSIVVGGSSTYGLIVQGDYLAAMGTIKYDSGTDSGSLQNIIALYEDGGTTVGVQVSDTLTRIASGNGIATPFSNAIQTGSVPNQTISFRVSADSSKLFIDYAVPGTNSFKTATLTLV